MDRKASTDTGTHSCAGRAQVDVVRRCLGFVGVWLVLLGATRVAAADDRSCYAGVETSESDGGSSRNALVVVREIDRTGSEIREHSWTDADGERRRTIVFKVDARAGTFEFLAQKSRGTGTLQGAPWRWTAYRGSAAIADRTLVIDGQLRGDSLAVTNRLAHRGKPVMTMRWEAIAFDCKELDKRRGALSPASSATAVRSCFSGTATASNDGKTFRAILVQTFDRTRIELRYRVAGSKRDHVDVLTIDGDKVMANGTTPARLTGKAGAWTGYSWSAKGSNGVLTFVDEGTLGGARATHKRSIVGGSVPMTMTIDATRFDCEELEARRAALPATP